MPVARMNLRCTDSADTWASLAIVLLACLIAPLGVTDQSRAQELPDARGGQAAGATEPRDNEVLLPGEEMVVDVRVLGNQSLPLRKISPYIRTRKGRPFDEELIEEDVRRLTRSGFFADVRPLYRRVRGGRVVIFEVVERPRVGYIKFVGAEKIAKKVLRGEIALEVGDALDPYMVAEARNRIEELYHTRGFDKVQVSVIEGSKTDDQGVVFLINEGAKKRILWTDFVGNTIASDARLRTQIQSKPGVFWFFGGEVDREKIDADIDRLVAYYRSLGFLRARVGRELKHDLSRNWLTLTFVIDEGPRYKIRDIKVTGNKVIPSEELSGSLRLEPGQYFNDLAMKSDVANIQEQYGAIGHVFADVKPNVRYLENEPAVDLVYQVEEGDRYRVGRINVEIDGDYPHTKITTVLNRLSFKPGDIVDIRELRDSEKRLRRSGLFMVDPQTGKVPKIVFTPPELNADNTQVASEPSEARERRRPGTVRYQSPDTPPSRSLPQRRTAMRPPTTHRYPASNVQRPTSNVQHPPVVRYQSPTRSTPTLPSQWQSTPPNYQPPPAYNPPARPAPTNPPVGNQFTPDPVQSGGQGMFAQPQGEIVPDPGPAFGEFPGVMDNALEPPLRELPMDVILKETRTGRFMFGVGVNSDAGLMGNIVIDEQNFDITRFPRSWEDIRNATAFRGAGQRLRLEAVPGTEVQRYMATFQEPYLLNTEVSLSLSGFYYDRFYSEWDEQRIGGRVALGYHFTKNLSGSLAFRGAEVTLSNPIFGAPTELTDALGENTLLGFGASITHDTRDSSFLATEGHLIELGAEQVVGTYSYPKVDIDLRRYFLLHQRPDGSGRHVVSLKTRFGWTGNDTPIYDHYYAGGFSTMRGFDFRGVSPIDPGSGVRVGGEFQLLASVEYMVPITADDMIRFVAFCDSGTVQRHIDDWQDKYRVAPGLGLRITIPAMGPAPIALDFAFPIVTEPGDDEEVFSFFVGFNH